MLYNKEELLKEMELLDSSALYKVSSFNDENHLLAENVVSYASLLNSFKKIDFILDGGRLDNFYIIADNEEFTFQILKHDADAEFGLL